MSRKWGAAAQVWDRMWGRHFAACQRQATDPASGAEISRLLDSLPAELRKRGIQCDNVEMTAALAYFEAMAGKRLTNRPRMLVWYDKTFKTSGRCGTIHGCWRFRPPPWPSDYEEAPSLERMPTTTAAQEVRRDAPLELVTW